MLLMDVENLYAAGWSHVVSTTDSVAELEAFRLLIGAPDRALQLKRRPHLDLKLEPRERALARPEVLVFRRTVEMLRYLHAIRNGTVAEAILTPTSSTDP
ncbi:MAG TPA: DUF4031 domain-containing protein [Gemmatimonadales bacterium]|jgi:hypothetical protein|nr:DUF4031 domain-containing protein [Gemmatimonadales bacterium]